MRRGRRRNNRVEARAAAYREVVPTEGWLSSPPPTETCVPTEGREELTAAYRNARADRGLAQSTAAYRSDRTDRRTALLAAAYRDARQSHESAAPPPTETPHTPSKRARNSDG